MEQTCIYYCGDTCYSIYIYMGQNISSASFMETCRGNTPHSHLQSTDQRVISDNQEMICLLERGSNLDMKHMKWWLIGLYLLLYCTPNWQRYFDTDTSSSSLPYTPFKLGNIYLLPLSAGPGLFLAKRVLGVTFGAYLHDIPVWT